MLKSAQASFRQNMSGIKVLHHWSMLEIAAVKLESNVNSTHVCISDHVIKKCAHDEFRWTWYQ